MGISPKLSVVHPTGETWESKNLHVADGSLFPTAVGVNPMITIEAVALNVACHIIESIRNEQNELQQAKL
jgi:choline dehydrogenase-like flavoprotein